MPPRHGDNREGLLKRSKRLFGSKPLDGSGLPANQHLGGADDATSSYQRRRSQVRRAQRTHRERKENYLKSLEHEVVSLRQQNKERARMYEADIAALRQIIVANGLPIPPQTSRETHASGQDSSVLGESPLATVSVGGNRQIGQFMQMQWSSSDDAFGGFLSPNSNSKSPDHHGDPGYTDSSQEAVSAPTIMQTSRGPSSLVSQDSRQTALPAQNQPQGLLNFSPQPTQWPPPLNNLTDSQIGIDFVLALEHPCMEHPQALREQNTGHTLMLSNELLCSSNAPAKNAEIRPDAPQSSWTVNPADLDRLLDLSTTFVLSGETTPVQAWTRLKQHPMFSSLDRGRLLAFQQALRQDVKCYGFGAVIDDVLFQIALEELFATSPSHHTG